MMLTCGSSSRCKNAMTQYGDTALHYAVRWGELEEHESVCLALIDAGAEIHVENNVSTQPVVFYVLYAPSLKMGHK